MNEAARLAELLVRAYGGELVSREEIGTGPADVDTAYRVQDLVVRRLAGAARPSAWKVSPARAGSAPVVSPVLPARVTPSPARVVPTRRGLLGVEAEIAFRLGPDLRPVAALVLVELCETRLADWAAAPALMKLADFQSNGALVPGSGTMHWSEVDFSRQEVEVDVDGVAVKRARGSHPSGDPSSLVEWAVRLAVPRGLQAGDLVTTGSWVGLVALPSNGAVRVRFPGIGECSLALAG